MCKFSTWQTITNNLNKVKNQKSKMINFSVVLVLLISSLLFLFDLVFCGSNTQCNDAWGCYDDSIDSENVYCRGYAACYGAEIVAEEYAFMTGGYTGLYADITSEYNAYCYGMYGCLGTTMDITNDFYNDGFASCAYSDVNIGDDYYSRGMYSGYDLTIDGEDYSYVQGLFGGAFSEMVDFVRTYNYGLFSLYYADIYSPGNATETVYFFSYGYYSAYGANFYCQGTDTCKIYCDSTGCSELTVYVENTASYSTSCSSSCAECPTVIEYTCLKDLHLSDQFLKQRSVRKERREWVNSELRLKDGLSAVENVQVSHRKNEIRRIDHHKKIYAATQTARKKTKLSNDIMKYHGIDNNLHEEAQLGLSVVNSIERTTTRNSKFNIDIASFVVGIIGSLTLGIAAQYTIEKIQSKAIKNI